MKNKTRSMSYNIDIEKGTISLLIVRILMILLAVVQFILIPRTLGPAGMGYYSYWLSIFFILSSVLGLGGFPLLSRYIPELRLNCQGAIKPLVNYLLLIKLPVFILVFGLGQFFFVHTRSAFSIICIGALLATIELIVEGIIYGYNRISQYSLMPLFRILFRIILLLSLYPLLQNKGILLAIVIAPLLTLLIFSASLFRILPESSNKLDRPLSAYLKSGSWLYFSHILSILTFWLIIGISKFFLNDITRIGLLGLSLQICLLISFLLFSVVQSMLPTFVEFHLNKDIRMSSSLKLSWKYTNLLLFPIVTGIFMLIRPVILILIGESFLPSVPLIRLFLPNIILFSWIFHHEQVLIIHEKMRSLFLIEFTRFIIFLILSVMLIKLHGISGGPVALFLGSLAVFGLILPITWKLEKIKKYLASILKPILGSILMAILIYLIKPDELIELLICGIIVLIFYFGILWIMRGIDKNDLQKFKRILINAKLNSRK